VYVHIDLRRRPEHWLQDAVQLKLCEQNGQRYHETDNPLPINGARNDMSFDWYGPQPNRLDCPFGFVRSNPEGQYQATGIYNNAEYDAATEQSRETPDESRTVAERIDKNCVKTQSGDCQNQVYEQTRALVGFNNHHGNDTDRKPDSCDDHK
jgi:hypothetical protein